MIVKGINFGPVSIASGALNFFGDGYPFHKLYRFIPGFDFTGTAFTSKTTTVGPRPGNMRLNSNFQPQEFIPACIEVHPLAGHVFNSVNLSGPGLKVLLAQNRWQVRQDPFWISIMSVANSVAERLDEMKRMVDMLGEAQGDFQAPFGVQGNFSCPNTSHDPATLIKEALAVAEIISPLKVPLDIKVNVLADVGVLKELDQCDDCHVLTCSNTIPRGALPDKIDWAKLSRSKKGPLPKFENCGLSGAPLLPIVADCIKSFRDAGIEKPIKGGGGILHPRDVYVMKSAGATAIEIGTAVILRPWMLSSITTAAYEYKPST